MLQVLSTAAIGSLGFGWACIGVWRRSLQHQLRSLSATKVAYSNASRKRPMVSLVLAVKGIRENSIENWRSQLSQVYHGRTEVLFCVENSKDPAYAAIRSLLIQESTRDTSKIVEAGLTFHNAQKIHNLLAGIREVNEDSEFVLFVDDDVRLHPGSVSTLVESMENDPRVFIATGYTMDLPAPSSPLASYALTSFRFPLLIGVHALRRFVWGGCMMLRTRDLVNDKHGLITSWREGGYSDDMLCGGICFAKKLRIAIPHDALFTSSISASTTFANFRNYLHRQCFVLRTYNSRVHLYCNIALGVMQISASLIIICGLCISILAPAFILADCVLCVPSNRAVHLILSSSVLVISSSALTALSLKRMTRSLRNFSTRLTSQHENKQTDSEPETLSWVFTLAGFLLYAAHVPWYTILSFFRKDILWGDNVYRISQGRVREVFRRVRPGSSIFFSHSFENSLAQARKDWKEFQSGRQSYVHSHS